MQRLTGATLAALLAGTIVGLAPASAEANSKCPPGSTPAPAEVGTICIPAVDRGNPGQPDKPDKPSRAGDDPCNYFLASPQPPAGSPPWGGHSPEDGKIYMKDCEDSWEAYGLTLVFIANGQEAPPNPTDLAQRALDQMRLTVPDVRLAPAPPAKTYVGLETWLWMPSEQWRTITKSVNAGSTTVTVTAEPRAVVWDMGAGSTTCYDAGREWKVGQMSKSATTSCQYTYERVSDFQPDKKFKVTATITFRANWTCSGNCLADEGSLGEVDGLPGASAIQVGERQSVNTTPKGR